MSQLLIEFEHSTVLVEVEPCRLRHRVTLSFFQRIPSSSRMFHCGTCSSKFAAPIDFDPIRTQPYEAC